MIEITKEVLSPNRIVNGTKTSGSGCVVTYVGVIRDNSHDKKVASVEYQDPKGDAVNGLRKIADEAMQKWALENVSIVHRIGKLKVGDYNIIIAVAAGHRQEGFAACQYIIDNFKDRLPTTKVEKYLE